MNLARVLWVNNNHTTFMEVSNKNSFVEVFKIRQYVATQIFWNVLKVHLFNNSIFKK